MLRERWWPWKGRRRTLTLGQATPLGVDFNSPFPPPPQKPLRLRLKRRRHGGKERGGGSKRRILIRGYRTISRRIKGAEGSAEPLLDSPSPPSSQASNKFTVRFELYLRQIPGLSRDPWRGRVSPLFNPAPYSKPPLSSFHRLLDSRPLDLGLSGEQVSISSTHSLSLSSL